VTCQSGPDQSGLVVREDPDSPPDKDVLTGKYPSLKEDRT
jgi:hypothetical protein